MTAALLAEFIEYPAERELIGQMLLAYGELEFALLGCLCEVLTEDVHTTTKVLFRVNGEAARIRVADAILRPEFSKHRKLKDKWITAYSALRHCKNIRNQYAHCHWQLHEGKLSFIDLDQDAQADDDVLKVGFRPIDLPLLQRQNEYFEYAASWLYFLRDRLMRAAGRELDIPPFPEPKSIPKPPLDSRPT
jgi:hypothetical protein